MNVTCKNCKAKLNIPENKIPTDKDTSFKCPKCKARIDVHAVKKPKPKVKHQASARTRENSDDRQSFDFIDHDTTSALICIDDKAIKKKAYEYAKLMGYNVNTVENSKTAIQKMQYSIFDIVIITDTFESRKGFDAIVNNLNKIDMSLRRRICLLVISRQYKTNDNMAALNLSANQIINSNDINNLGKIMIKALNDHKQLYTVFNNSLAQVRSLVY